MKLDEQIQKKHEVTGKNKYGPVDMISVGRDIPRSRDSGLSTAS